MENNRQVQYVESDADVLAHLFVCFYLISLNFYYYVSIWYFTYTMYDLFCCTDVNALDREK